jgi:transposase InsO family protein
MTGPQGKGSAASVERLCSLAGVSRASFYRDWANTAPGREETELRDVIQCAVLASKHYGYRRITAELRRQGWAVNHKRVLRLMREDNLLCLRRVAFKPATTDSDHAWRIWPNLARKVVPMAVNRLSVADITYVRLAEEFWQSSSMPSAARSSAGLSKIICGPAWRSRPWRWRWPDGT